jgi:hypothetical protein
MPIVKKPARKVAKKSTKKAAKKVAKKTTKKAVTKRPYHRKDPALSHIAIEIADAKGEPVTDIPMPPSMGAEEFVGMVMGAVEDNGQYASSGVLNCNPINKVRAARGRMTECVKRLMQVTLDVANCSNASQSEVDVAIAKRNLAIAEFELSIDDLEKVIRG